MWTWISSWGAPAKRRRRNRRSWSRRPPPLWGCRGASSCYTSITSRRRRPPPLSAYNNSPPYPVPIISHSQIKSQNKINQFQISKFILLPCWFREFRWADRDVRRRLLARRCWLHTALWRSPMQTADASWI